MSSESTNPTATGGAVQNPILSLDGQDLKQLVESGLTWLRCNQQIVNELNVFPVPDGDTGTNMMLTMQAAFAEITDSEDSNIGKMAHTIAQGALMGARGNSGVILSQIWRGFARALDTTETMDANLLINAMAEARNTAYKGVVRPVEGTILTVIKDSAAAAEEALKSSNDMRIILEKIVEGADISVQHTPELLPVLKQAGVVDSGGKGLFFIMEGMLRQLKGLPLEIVAIVQSLSAMQLVKAGEEIEPGQEVEVVIDFQPDNPLDLENFYSQLSEMGTSIQIGEGDGMYRMHIHVTNERRFDPINYIMGLGTWSKIAMENLVAQVNGQASGAIENPPLKLPEIEAGQIGVVAVSPGKGISRVFASLGAAAIVDGGQSMNPSTEEILSACDNLPCEHVLILPNNKNIILAAQNAATVAKKHIHVIPSRSIPQGISAMFRYSPDAEIDGLVSEMNEALSEVMSGEITIATRSVEIDGVDVREGEVIALLDGKLLASSQTLGDACLELLEKAHTEDKELITLFYGNNIQIQEVNQIHDLIHVRYPDHEIEVKEGGQPYYQFIIAIE
jgi:uncharacterized protein